MEDYDESLHEQTLANELSALRSLFEYHPDGIMTLKTDGRIARVNVALEGMTGFYAEQIVGKGWIDLVAPEMRPDAAESLRVALRGESAEHVTLLLDRLGNRLDVALKLVPLRVEAAIHGAYAIFRDISAQKDAERLIERQSERMRRLYEVAAHPGGSREAKVDATLALGVEMFDFDCAYVTHVVGGVEIVRNVASSAESSVVQTGAPAPAASTWGSLIEVPLRVEDQSFGRLAFAGRTPNHAALANRDRDVMHLIALSVTNLIERMLQSERIEALAFSDAVTGLPNRVLFDMRIAHTLATARRYERGFSVMYLDLDHFKKVNDRYGHPIGDRVLAAFGERLQEQLRESDTLARLGGDEFAILQPIVDGPSDAADLARKLHTALQEPLDVDGVAHDARASIGIALYPGDGETPADLIAAADRALYDAKHGGRNRWSFANEASVRNRLKTRPLRGGGDGR